MKHFSAFALLCFALLCGLAASSVVQPETETELTKKEGEPAGNKLLVEQALESREVRGASKRRRKSDPCKKNKKSKRCQRAKKRSQKKIGRNNRKNLNTNSKSALTTASKLVSNVSLPKRLPKHNMLWSCTVEIHLSFLKNLFR